MGSTHFQMKTLKHVGTEMALRALAYNLTRVMNIVGIKPLIAAIAASDMRASWLRGSTPFETVFTRPDPERTCLPNCGGSHKRQR